MAEENRLKTAEVAALMGVDGTVLQTAAGRLTYITGLQYTINTLQLKLNAISAQLKTYGVDTEGVNTLYEAYLQAQEDYNSKMDALNNAALTNERSIASAFAGLGSISNKIKRQQEKIKAAHRRGRREYRHRQCLRHRDRGQLHRGRRRPEGRYPLRHRGARYGLYRQLLRHERSGQASARRRHGHDKQLLL